MALVLKTAPTVEPVTLAEVKAQLRLDSGSLADNLTTKQSIVPGSHAVAPAYSLVGNAFDVLGYNVVVNLNSGANGGGATVDAKMQDSDDGITYADVTSGAFTQVTEANDNAIQELAYTGGKKYLRVVATVAGAACEFGVDILQHQPYSSEDLLITSYIKAAREWCEVFQRRAFVTQTWELWWDAFPDLPQIRIPLPPLQSVTSVVYYDVDEVPHTFDSGSYQVDIKNQPGWIVLKTNYGWPSTILRPANGVCVTFVAGYGVPASVPESVKLAILLLVGDYFANREAGSASEKTITAVERLLWPQRSF